MNHPRVEIGTAWSGRTRKLAQRHRNVIFAALAGVAILLVASTLVLRHPARPAAPISVPVNVAKVKVADVPVSISALGAAQAWTSVTILAQVSGKLLSVDFTEGSDVKKGQILAQIDPAPYLAVLTQTEGTLTRDQALLANARLDLTRYLNLEAQNAIALQIVDTQRALVREYEGTVKTDEGAVAAARVNLNWCKIVSPIDGRVGVRLVDPGNLVSANGSVSNTPSTAAATNVSSSAGNSNSGIVIVNQIQPIAVTFTVPENDFEQLRQSSHAFRNALVTRAFSQETGKLLGIGQLSIADNHVDPDTGTIELKARFPNPQRLLWPGQFVNVELTTETLHRAIVIPAAAVNRGPNGTFAFVIGRDHRASVRPIRLGWSQNSIAVVKTGLTPGEIVVTDGQMILKADSLVTIVPGQNSPGTE